ncbi:MAG: methyl-accepting chemotaxis protein [Kiritimatiellia bacterium]|jgi:methyl-accepting chemotaxis protein
MLNFTHRINIFPKLLISVLCVVAIPLSGIWYVNSVKYHDEIQSNLRHQLSQSGDLLTEKINGWTNVNFRLLQYSAKLSDIASMDEDLQTPILKNILETYEWTYLVFSVGADGYKVARSDDKGILKPDGSKAFFRGDRAYFQQVMTGKKFGQQVLLSRTLGKPAFVLCSAIRRVTIAGALCIGMTLESISTLVTQLELGETGYAILLDSNNKVIAHGQPGVLQENLKDFSAHPMVRLGRFKYTEYETGGVRKVGYRAETSAGWSLIVEQNYDEVFAPLKVAQQQALIFLAMTIFVSVLVAYFISMRIAKPIVTTQRV